MEKRNKANLIFSIKNVSKDTFEIKSFFLKKDQGIIKNYMNSPGVDTIKVCLATNMESINIKDGNGAFTEGEKNHKEERIFPNQKNAYKINLLKEHYGKFRIMTIILPDKSWLNINLNTKKICY